MGKYKIVGTVAITEREFKNLKKGRVTYKLVNKQWYKLCRKDKDKTKLLNHIAKLQAQIKSLMKGTCK